MSCATSDDPLTHPAPLVQCCVGTVICVVLKFEK